MSITQKEDEKQQLIQNIRNYVLIDAQLQSYNEKVKKCRELKNTFSASIYKFMEKHNCNNIIQLADGELHITEKKDVSPLTFSYVEKCLSEMIDNKEHVLNIILYLKENREVKYVKEIRKIGKK